MKIPATGGSEPGEIEDSSGSITATSSSFLQPYVANLRTTGFANGPFYGRDAPGAAPASTHDLSDSTGGGFICFENLSNTTATVANNVDVKLTTIANRDASTPGGTADFYNPKTDAVLTMPHKFSAIGTITYRNNTEAGGCQITYVSPTGQCYHGDLNTDIHSGVLYLGKEV